VPVVGSVALVLLLAPAWLARQRAAPSIAATERRITTRLAQERVPTTPITGPLRIRATGIVWRDSTGTPFLRIDRVVASLSSRGILKGDIVIPRLEVIGPRLTLARAPGSTTWNYESALKGVLGAPGPSPPSRTRRTVLIENASITNGALTIRPPSGEAIAFEAIAARLPRITISAPEVKAPRILLARLATTVVWKNVRERVTVAGGEFDLPPGRLAFNVARIGIDGSVLAGAHGEYRFGAPGLGLDATVHAERIELASLRPFLPHAPLRGTARFDLLITTNAAGRSTVDLTHLVAEGEGSRITGVLRAAFGGRAPPALLAIDLRLEPLTLALIEQFTGPLPYGGEIRGRIHGSPTALDFDLAALLTTPSVAGPFRASLSGRAALTATGFGIRSLDIELHAIPLLALRPFIPGLSAEGLISGHVSMQGTPGKVPTELDVRLELVAGVITLAGVIDLTGRVPRYDLSGRLIGVHLDDLFAPPVPPAILTARYALAGTGTKLAQVSARLTFIGQFTGWQTGPTDSVLVRAALEGGTVALDTLGLTLGPLSVAASGTWHAIPPGSGALSYRVAVRSLSPFSPFRGQQIAGAIQTSGLVEGTLAHPRFIGQIATENLVYDGFRGDSLGGRYDVTLAAPLPQGEVQLAGRGLTTPVGVFDSATVTFAYRSPRLSLDLRARRSGTARALVVAADGEIGPGNRREVVLRALELELDNHLWALAYPARIMWLAGESLTIERFLFRDTEGPGRIAISGRYPPATAADVLTVDVLNLPVGEVLALLNQAPIASGLLTVHATARGPAAAPTLSGDFRLTNGNIYGEPVADLQGMVLAEDRRLDAQALARLDSLGVVRATASIPLVLTLQRIPHVELLGNAPMHVTLTADSLALAALAQFTAEVRDVAGTLRARLDVSGTPAAPVLAGELQLFNGAMTIVPLNQRYDSISADILFQNQVATIRRLQAHAGGWARVLGTVSFTQPANPTFALVANLTGFRPLGADDLEPAAVDGTLRLTGTLAAPVIAGEITVDDGNLMIPSFHRGGLSGPAVQLASTPPPVTGPAAPPAAPAPPPGPSLFDRLRIEDVLVHAGPNLWFVIEQGRAQLSGDLLFHKVEDGLEISGTLTGTRGVFTLRLGPIVRRLTITSATIRFFGTPELNPALDITATRIFPGIYGQMATILIHVTGTLNAPRVSVTTATGAPVPESELISFLLFGRPGYAAQGPLPFGTPFLHEALFGVGSLAELASIGIEEALVADLGLPLDYFLIQPTIGPFGGLAAPTIVLGEEITNNVYLTVNAGLAGLFGPAITPATAWTVLLTWQFTPQWSLVLGVEPVNPALFFRGIGTALPVVGFQQQLIVELRRRWTY
jgi:hypothetical protein